MKRGSRAIQSTRQVGCTGAPKTLSIPERRGERPAEDFRVTEVHSLHPMTSWLCDFESGTSFAQFPHL